MIDKLLTLIRGEFILLRQTMAKLLTNSVNLDSSLKELSREVRNQKAPTVNVAPPKVTVNVPDVVVPKITIPDISLPEIKLPKIELPQINVPKPEVTVNIPEIKVPKPEKPAITVNPPKVEVNVEDVDVKGLKGYISQIIAAIRGKSYSIFTDVSKDNPIPVILTDENGNFYKALMKAVGGGGYSVVGLKNTEGNQISPMSEDTGREIVAGLREYLYHGKKTAQGYDYFSFKRDQGTRYRIMKKSTSDAADVSWATGDDFTTDWDDSNYADLEYGIAPNS